MKIIERFLKEDILELLDHFPIVGILGSRQAGKTTLAKNIIKNNPQGFLYLDLELPSDLEKLDQPEFYLDKNRDKCIVLDEVQRKPELFALLRSLVDQNRVPGRFVLLGSASPAIVKGVSESLAGRIINKELHGFNLLEISGNGDIDLVEHWVRGGYPSAYLNSNTKIRALWHQSFIQTYTERDLPALGLQADPTTMRRFLTMLAHIHGEPCKYDAIAESLTLSVPTVKKYINYFSESFIVRILPPWYMNIRKRLVRSHRIFFKDSGLLHALLNIDEFDDLHGHPKLGKSWEGYVIEQICQLIDDRYQAYFYRTHQGAEIDLVLVKGGSPQVSIEVKYGGNPSIPKGFYIATEDLGTQSNFVITMNGEDYLASEQIRTCNLYTFLTIYLPNL